MNIYVIETPGMNRSQPIRSALQGCEEFTAIYIPAIMINQKDEVPDEFCSQFVSRYGRDVLPGEYGCLLSHRAVWDTVARTRQPGIVFEDDARQIVCSSLSATASRFLSKQEFNAAILSFHDPRYFNRKHIFGAEKFFRLCGSSSHAVAYLITPLAASNLLDSSNDFASVADWPSSSIAYFLSPWQVVHGDNISSSVISDLGPRINLTATIRTWKILSLQHFLENREVFASFHSYVRVILLPLLKIKIDSFRMKLFTVKINDHRS